MAEDWAADVRRYAPDAADAVIARVVRHCGIALQNRDSSQISLNDPAEISRVRDNFCRKKLGLTDPDATIDAGIARVGERLQGDATKNRVTVYYLLAEAFGKLALFGATAAAPVAPSVAPAMPAPAMPAPAVAAPVVAASVVVAAAPAMAAAAPTPPMVATTVPDAAPRDGGPDGGRRGSSGSGVVLAGCGTLAAIILGTAVLGSLIGGEAEREPTAAAVVAVPAVAEPVAAALPVAPAPAIPDGAGVVVQETAETPAVSVYFDTAKSDVSPDFATVAAPLKAWIDGHPGAQLVVSGYNDPRGDPAFNAELSKNRAKAVAAALAAMGVPAAAVDLEKPPETTDAGTSAAQARRVDITVRDAG